MTFMFETLRMLCSCHSVIPLLIKVIPCILFIPKNSQRIRQECSYELTNQTLKLLSGFGEFLVVNYTCFKNVDVYNFQA